MRLEGGWAGAPTHSTPAPPPRPAQRALDLPSRDQGGGCDPEGGGGQAYRWEQTNRWGNKLWSLKGTRGEAGEE